MYPKPEFLGINKTVPHWSHGAIGGSAREPAHRPRRGFVRLGFPATAPPTRSPACAAGAGHGVLLPARCQLAGYVLRQRRRQPHGAQRGAPFLRETASCNILGPALAYSDTHIWVATRSTGHGEQVTACAYPWVSKPVATTMAKPVACVCFHTPPPGSSFRWCARTWCARAR